MRFIIYLEFRTIVGAHLVTGKGDLAHFRLLLFCSVVYSTLFTVSGRNKK